MAEPIERDMENQMSNKNTSTGTNRASGSTGSDVVIKLLNDIFATRPDEIQCDQVADEIVQCADRRLTDDEARERHPAMYHHFRYCEECANEYAMVMDFVRQDAAGLVLRPVQIPPLPAYGAPAAVQISERRLADGQSTDVDESGLMTAVRRIANWLSDALTPPMQLALVRGRQLGDRPVTAAMEGGEVTLTLILKAEPASPHTRRLDCIVETMSAKLEAALDSAPIQLVNEEDGKIVQDQLLNEVGDATFTGIAPGVYALQWSLAGQDYRASELEIA